MGLIRRIHKDGPGVQVGNTVLELIDTDVDDERARLRVLESGDPVGEIVVGDVRWYDLTSRAVAYRPQIDPDGGHCYVGLSEGDRNLTGSEADLYLVAPREIPIGPIDPDDPPS